MDTNTHLSASDLKAFTFLHEKQKEGQAQAQQAHAILEDAKRRDAALQGFFGYLAAEYGLGEGDGIDEDGKIIRAPKREEEPQEPPAE